MDAGCLAHLRTSCAGGVVRVCLEDSYLEGASSLVSICTMQYIPPYASDFHTRRFMHPNIGIACIYMTGAAPYLQPYLL
eukprot:5982640-Pyramimonas_sp.AAC.2